MEVWIDGAWILSIGVGFVISFILVLYWSISDEEIGGFIVVILTAILSSILANFVFLEEHKYENVEIENIHLLSLKTINSTEGDFFAIYSGEKYSGFIKTEKGYLKIIMPGNSEIIPDNNKIYYSKTCSIEYERFYIPFIYKKDWKKSKYSSYRNCRSYIHIPEDSIKFEYKIK